MEGVDASLETMIGRIEMEKRGRPFDEITRLCLDECKAEQIEGLTEEFKNLKSLSLGSIGLTTLKGFPKLPLLQKLDLSGNELSGSLGLLAGCPKLTRLNLSANKIKDLEALEPLKDFAELKHLELFECEVTALDDYRDKVFAILPNLPFLDGFNKDNEEDEEDGSDSEDEEEGEEDDDDEEEEEEEVGLSYLQKSGLEDEDSEGEEFQPNGANEDEDEEDDSEGEELDDDAEEEEEEEAEGKEKSPAVERGRGIKRKRTAAEDDAAPPAKKDDA